MKAAPCALTLASLWLQVARGLSSGTEGSDDTSGGQAAAGGKPSNCTDGAPADAVFQLARSTSARAGNMTAGTPPRQSFCYQAAPWAPGMLSCSVEGTFGCSLGNREHRIRKLNRGREREAGIRAVRSECVLVLSTARLVVLFSALA